MESQLHHTHGRHYDESDLLATGHHTSHDHNEDEHHGEKKSVMKKVKEKAKKIKNTITKHGHGHGHDHDQHHHDEEEEDNDDDETVEDPEVHGAPMYDSARVVGQGANLGRPIGNLERPSMMAEDRYAVPVANRGSPASGIGEENWRNKVGQSTGMEEEPFAPNPTRMASPIGVADHTHGTQGRRIVGNHDASRGEGHDVNQGGLRGIVGKGTSMIPDPAAPKDPLSLGSEPSNYGAKVTNPAHTGGKEAELSQLQHSFDKMAIESEPKTFGHNHPENLPHDTLTGNPSSQSSSYANKISSSASAIADKAVAAKDVIASKLGYSGQNPTSESHVSGNYQTSVADYAHKMTDKVTETLAPVYEKVVDTGSSVISKVQGSVSGTGQSQPQVHGGSEFSTPDKEERVTDKGVSVKEHLVETLRPGEEDKALSEVITNALHRGKEGEIEKRLGEDRPMGTVTESVEVRRRLGTDRREEQHDSGNVAAADWVKETVGSWFGGKGEAPQGTPGDK